jgi:serine/threonine protein kinase
MHLIGRGAYASVYYDEARGTAVKIQPHSDGPENGLRASALREARILNNLRHPRILSLREIRLTNDVIFLCTEYLPRTLRQLLSEQKPADANVRAMARELFEALEFCHSKGVMHRDVTPDNIMLTTDARVKLTDFGLAREVIACVSDETQRAYTLQTVTLWYRPPEVLREQSYDTRLDVWSAGCVFGEMCLGRPLFPGKNEVEMVELTLCADHLVNEMPTELLRALAARCLCSANERATAAAAVAMLSIE